MEVHIKVPILKLAKEKEDWLGVKWNLAPNAIGVPRVLSLTVQRSNCNASSLLWRGAPRITGHEQKTSALEKLGVTFVAFTVKWGACQWEIQLIFPGLTPTAVCSLSAWSVHPVAPNQFARRQNPPVWVISPVNKQQMSSPGGEMPCSRWSVWMMQSSVLPEQSVQYRIRIRVALATAGSARWCRLCALPSPAHASRGRWQCLQRWMLLRAGWQLLPTWQSAPSAFLMPRPWPFVSFALLTAWENPANPKQFLHDRRSDLVWCYKLSVWTPVHRFPHALCHHQSPVIPVPWNICPSVSLCQLQQGWAEALGWTGKDPPLAACTWVRPSC